MQSVEEGVKTIREFDHGSHFVIQAELTNGLWKARVLCDGTVLGEPATESDETVVDGRTSGHDLLEVIAREFERLVRSMYDLKIKPYRR